MPELPEVQTVVSELNRKLKGLTIVNIEVNTPKIIAVGSAVVSNIRKLLPNLGKKFSAAILGAKFVSVNRRAKMLIFTLNNRHSLLVHLKMTGQFIFEDVVQRKKTNSHYRILNRATAPLVKMPSKHTHVVFHFSNGSILYFNDIRQFGYIRLVTDKQLAEVKEFAQYGPEPLSKEFTQKLFIEQMNRRSKTSVKQALLDPKVVAGIGNIYSDEILFHAKVMPTRMVGSLSKKELEAIYQNISPVLKTAIKHKGSSVGDFIRTDGKWGSMGKHHFVYGRKGQPCKHCGTIIKSVKLGGRTSCYCPKDQK